MSEFVMESCSVNAEGNLTVAGVDTTSLAREYGTPLMVMDENKIREICRIYKNAMTENFGADALPLFASKALSFKGIYRIIAEEGLGSDAVSSGEIYTAKSRHQSSSYYIGQSARVAYNREDPSQAIVKPKGVLYAVIFLMIAAGAAVAVNSFIK